LCDVAPTRLGTIARPFVSPPDLWAAADPGGLLTGAAVRSKTRADGTLRYALPVRIVIDSLR